MSHEYGEMHARILSNMITKGCSSKSCENYAIFMAKQASPERLRLLEKWIEELKEEISYLRKEL